MNKIFRVSETESTILRHRVFANVVECPQYSSNGTEDSFHSIWHDNIGKTLGLVLLGEAIRNSNHHTSTALKRPNYGFLLNGKKCLFRGEEKAPGSSEDPRVELLDKLVWTYDPLQFILGE